MSDFNFFSEKEVKLLFNAKKNKNYIHLHTSSPKLKEIMDINKLNDILSIPNLWNSRNFKMVLDRKSISFNQFSTEGLELGYPRISPDPSKVQDYVKKGASLVLDDIIYAVKNVKRLAIDLQNITWGKCQANLYFSMQSHQAFGPHYDTHDVFALHCEGEKIWNIYENLEDNPINHPIFKPTLEERIKSAGKIKDQVLLKPGDLLYLPRGQYHDALASKNGAIHIAFGINYMKPIDVFQSMWENLIINPYLRSDIKDIKSTSDISEINKKILKEIQNILEDKNLLVPLFNNYKNWPYKLSDYQLDAVVEEGVQYQISKLVKISKKNDQTLITNGKEEVAVPKKFEDMTNFSFEVSNISAKILYKKFEDIPQEDVDEFILAMKNMRVFI